MTYIPGSGSGGSISTSSDVALSNATDGDVLSYDGSLAKWKNAPSSTFGAASRIDYREYVNGSWQVRGDVPAGTIIFWIKRDTAIADPPADSTYLLAGVDLIITGASSATTETAATTWQQAWDSKSTSTLRQWFVDNCKPRIAIDTANPILGPITLNTQADADVLKGKQVNGEVLWAGSNIVLEDVLIRSTGTCIKFVDNGTDPYGNTMRYVELDGMNAIGSRGIGGISYFKMSASYVNIHSTGDDATRLGEKPTNFEHMFIHDLRRWNNTTDGTYSSSTDPHTDGVQAVRGGGVIRKSWIDLGVKDPNDTGVILLKPDSAPIDGVAIDYNYLNGGHYTIFVHNSTSYPTPTNVKVNYNRFGRDYGAGLWSFNPVGYTGVERIGNVWADDMTAVTLAEGPL